MIQLFIALLLFTVFAICGLVADLGFVRLAQRQMNHATDTAALEGMRLADAATDLERREATRLRIHDVFDDNFGSRSDDPYQYGAGPLVTLQGGQGALGANKQVVVAPSVVYKPEPQLNLPNAQHGDFVAGYYDAGDPDHAESTAYDRSDFGPVASATRNEAFLVRLRRTNDDEGLDAQPGVSSRGPAIPYLFARGSLMAGATREAGVTVRSASIAQARNVTLAGPPHEAYGMEGTAPFAIELDYWNSRSGDFVLQFGALDPTGGSNPGGPPLPNPNPTQGAPPIIPPGQMVGGATEPNAVFADRLDDPSRRSWSVGDPVWVDLDPDVARALALLGDPLDPGFAPRRFLVPLYEGDVLWFYDGRPGNSNPPFLPPVTNVPKDDMDPRIVGFGTVTLLGATVNAGGVVVNGVEQSHVQLTLRKEPAYIWPANVSAVQTPGLADLPRWLADQIIDLNDTIDEPARTAALGR
jgi:hypothetical protein